MSLDNRIKWNENRKRWIVDFTDLGRRTRHSFRTKYEAEKALKKLIRGESVKRYSIDYCLKEYHDTKFHGKGDFVKEKRYLNLFYIFCQKHKLVGISEIKHRHIEKLKNWLREDHKFEIEGFRDHQAVGNATVNRYFACYGPFFKFCLANDFLEKNPLDFVHKLPVVTKKRSIMTDLEFNLFIGKCPGWFRPVAEFLYLTGLRPSSVSRLTWGDVDFDGGFLSYSTKKGYRGGESEKTFPLIPRLRALLEALKDSQRAHGTKVQDDSFIFLNQNYVHLKSNAISKVGNEALRRAGLKDHREIDLYSLRHKLATDLRNAGTHTTLIGQLLGHSSEEMAKRHYVADAQVKDLGTKLALVRAPKKFRNGTNSAQTGEVATLQKMTI